MPFAAYLKSMLGLTALAAAAVAAFNYTVDPFFYFGRNPFGVYISAEREYKAGAIARYPHDAIIMGSSVTANIDPDAVKGFRFFNASFSGARPEEILDFVKHYVRQEKLVVIGLDLFMFNESFYPFSPVSIFGGNGHDAFDYTLSASVLSASIETIEDWSGGKPPFLERNGQRNNGPREKADEDLPGWSYDHTVALLRDHHFRGFQYSERRIDVMRQLKTVLDARHIDMIVFINPLHPRLLQLAESMGLSPDMERLSHDMSTIFGRSFSDLSRIRPDDAAYYKTDVLHYKPGFGAALVSRLIEARDGRAPRLSATAAERMNTP